MHFLKYKVLNPGGFMITNSRIYFQPAQLNNVGDKVLYFEMKSVQRVYCRRFLLLDTGNVEINIIIIIIMHYLSCFIIYFLLSVFILT